MFHVKQKTYACGVWFLIGTERRVLQDDRGVVMKTKVAVIGAGHAGIEAALASARMGIDTVLFTMSLDAIGNMPCNPSIGGTAKGHLVYEIDALGGEMGRAADRATLQSRTLNTGKGAAVRSKRVQADRKLYQRIMKHTLEITKNLRLIQAEITEILTEELPENEKKGEEKFPKRICGVRTAIGEVWECECAVIATGTYLKGRIFVGDRNFPSGPDGLLPANSLSESIAAAGIRLVRFKTGTPARVHRESIDFSVLEEQPGETEAVPYAEENPDDYLSNASQLPCHVVYTNADTHRVILDNIRRSALYSGQIHGTGPRYCPSIEDKLVRFADKERHQLFVEPMGADTEEMYIQGFSTSLPPDVQREMLHTLAGFQNAEIMRYAYAIEYDCADPLEMEPSLMFRAVKGLFGAGQFNGTSGYEEAAAQGLIAGINAALLCKGEELLVLRRYDGYIGTLIDDLTHKGTNEPYRMMTSRSEYRLLLRQDNADLRLTPIGRHVGLVGDAQWERFCRKKVAEDAEKQRLEKTYISQNAANAFLKRHGQSELKSGVSLAELLKRPEISYEDLREIPSDWPKLDRRAIMTVETDVKYEGYIKRQLDDVERNRRLEERLLPADLDYAKITGLRIEAAQKLARYAPKTLLDAQLISGVNPADITVLMIYLGIR